MPSTATPVGKCRWALVAGPPSPPKPPLSNPYSPVPATVVIVPVESTMRIRLLLRIGDVEVARVPSTATSPAPHNCSWALVAGPPSPPKPYSPESRRGTLRIPVALIGDVEVARARDGGSGARRPARSPPCDGGDDPGWLTRYRRCRGCPRRPSPHPRGPLSRAARLPGRRPRQKPHSSVPATVVIVPVESTLRIRWLNESAM